VWDISVRKGRVKNDVLRLFFFFAVLGFEFRACTLTTPQAPFCDGFFEIGSGEFFAWGWLQTSIL
jgi:hypothetical protein